MSHSSGDANNSMRSAPQISGQLKVAVDANKSTPKGDLQINDDFLNLLDELDQEVLLDLCRNGDCKDNLTKIYSDLNIEKQELNLDFIFDDGSALIEKMSSSEIRDDIEELVGIIYKKCRLVEISTNGFYTDKLVKIAEKFPDVMIRISLEGLPALNDRLRGTKNGFDHALRSIMELKKTKIKDIGFSVVICDKNIKDLVNLYNLAVCLDVEFAQSTMHNSWYFHKTDNEIIDREIVAGEMERFLV